MAVYLLDTDILSLPQRKHAQAEAAIAAHPTDTVAISTVTIEEQVGGWSAIARAARTPAQQEHAAMFLAALVVSWAGFAIVPMTVAAVARFEALVKAKLNV